MMDVLVPEVKKRRRKQKKKDKSKGNLMDLVCSVNTPDDVTTRPAWLIMAKIKTQQVRVPDALNSDQELEGGKFAV
ncbi:hypothetical protein C5167_036289 [Papaver somniferum]|nr:hypothetical protein C5167_036289 [Papaver somniferum]